MGEAGELVREVTVNSHGNASLKELEGRERERERGNLLYLNRICQVLAEPYMKINIVNIGVV